VPCEETRTVEGKAAANVLVKASNLAPRPASHLTVVETVYFRSGNDAPVSSEARYSRFIPGIEQVYIRHLTIGPEWADLDTGWLKTLSLVTLRNSEGDGQQVRMSADERAALAGRVVEVGVEIGGAFVAFAVVRPGETGIRLEPVRPLFLRAPSGSARVTVTAFPG
jgi:hypothetical protein